MHVMGSALRYRVGGWLISAAVVTPLVPLQPQAAVAAQAAAPCEGDFSTGLTGHPKGPPIRFGIYPGGEAGQLVVPASGKPDKQVAILSALHQLQPPGRPFVVHLYREYSTPSVVSSQEQIAAAATRLYTAQGFQVEWVLRYRKDDDPAGFAGFVRAVVRKYGANPGVVAFQVTNEVNFPVSGDSSDGVYKQAQDALIAGVEAGSAEARADGYRQVGVGFNWFYRYSPSSDQAFWQYLHDHGGAALVRALDWVGLDIYPGTFFPPAWPNGQEGGPVVNGLSLLRRCYLPTAGISSRTPIHVQENGWPTGPGRSEAMQETALQAMIGTLDAGRIKYNVSDYRWFDLRDADSTSPNFQQQFGLMHDDYTPKPAFGAYRQLIARLAGAAPAASASKPGMSGTGSPGAPPGADLPATSSAGSPGVPALLLGSLLAGALLARLLCRTARN
jgi:hypothetical protein